nr:immunoglobulin heavy chain junction region [Macaca mulatta]
CARETLWYYNIWTGSSTYYYALDSW